MKLIELDPRWFDIPGVGGAKDGITFLCPCAACGKLPQRRRLAVQFANPIGGDPKPPMTQKEKNVHLFELRSFDVAPSICWQRTGETFEDLTLSPSVDASNSGHWHGSITNGEIR